ncbi:putative RNA methyltransferase pc0248 [Candidatus Protochlamydia amoebophila]|uniref:23S rRNA (uracil(1939)-C(5))-methyltransferase RlmD n=1 Tax=Candidatus Protochlamydia amoebophila TaxID=362787 RepID=UPI001BCA61EA|nr:23S rRNA (uracil(1939)-C(5))-methyltransferase RlmD [Candidatus Protochlamydia amoebophila]MBS4164440.1 putative RNA methyltransferase pc0248 [Candidatus Protochlamydia amoebophila]
MTHLLTIHTQVEGEITAIAFGGAGILRYYGFVIFVPFTAPGDQIICRIIEIKKSFAVAELVKLKHPSSLRVQPPCPYFGKCGGCQLQHLNEQTQLNYKLTAITDTLKRIGHLKVPSVEMSTAQLNWAYRRHITLHLKSFNQSFQAGYIATDHFSLISIDTCPIFNNLYDPIIGILQKFISTLPNSNQQDGRLTLLKNQNSQYILSFQFCSLNEFNRILFQEALEKYPILSGILVTSPKKQWIIGNPYSEQKIENLIFRFTPQAFIQNHPEQSLYIYKKICSLTTQLKSKKILDLYCGFGITSLLLANQGHFVTGIEYNSDAIRFAKENSKLNHLPHVEFLEGDVEKILPICLKSQKCVDLVIVNPPRIGLSKSVIKILMSALPEDMIYISCMPSTLARDLSILCEDLYKIHECTAYDMFPQTSHVETLVHLKKV